MDQINLDHLRQWIGRQETASEHITPGLVDRFLSTIVDAKPKPDIAPLGIQWCLAPPAIQMDALGHDGHPAKGSFLPPVPYAQRMWAGGELTFVAPLKIGDHVKRRSTIVDIQTKLGSSGNLCFVTVRHEYLVGTTAHILERQDIVYRDISTSKQRVAVKKVELPQAESINWTDPTSTLLFRFSALTFNGHRIHYDHPFATDIEGHGGLLVHGPLQAIMMATLAENTMNKPLKRLIYRGITPLDNTADFITGLHQTDDGILDCWCGREDTGVTMKGQAFF